MGQSPHDSGSCTGLSGSSFLPRSLRLMGHYKTHGSLYSLVTDKLLVEPLRGPLCGDRDCDNICGWNKTLFIIHINCLLQRIINGSQTKDSQV